MTNDIGTLLNLACLKYTGQTLPDCGGELQTTWKYKLVDGKKIAVQHKPSPLYLRPSSNFSIELDIKRRMIVSNLKSIFSHKEDTETAKFRYDIITSRDLCESSHQMRKDILYVIDFTHEQIELIVERIRELPYCDEAFLLLLYKLGIPYDSKGVQGFLKLKDDRYKRHPEHLDYSRRKDILKTYSENKPEYFETEHTINKKFWYGSRDSYYDRSRERAWRDRHDRPESVQFRIENPDNYKKDEHLKKGKKFQLDYLNRRFACDGACPLLCSYNNQVWSMIQNWDVRDEWVHKYGREWLDEGKLDTKTLLRVYADKRESYEDVVNRICF